MSADLLSFILQDPQFRKPRLPSLYSDFRYLRTTNPNGYVANVTAWKAALASATRAGLVGDGSDHLVFTSSADLTLQLATQDWGRPLALGVAMADAVHANEFYPLDEFVRRKESIYHWTYAGAVLGWGLEKAGLRSTTPGQKVPDGRYVVVKNVEEHAKEILRKVAKTSTRAGRLFTKDLFAEELAPGISQTDLRILATFLSRDLSEAVYDDNVIKFKNDLSPLTPINEQDTTIAQLRSLLHSLHARIDSLSTAIAASAAKASKAIAAKNRTLALLDLKSKKVAETALADQVKRLGQVEEVMAAIEQAASNIELVRQLERSSKVLTTLNKEVGGIERVDRVFDDLREQTDMVDEVTQALNDAAPVVDEQDVEDELEAMMREEQEREQTTSVKVPPPEREEEQLANALQGLDIKDAPPIPTTHISGKEAEKVEDQRPLPA